MDEKPSGRLSVPYVLIYYLPENCNPSSRMSYAGAVELMRNTAEVNKVIEVAGVSFGFITREALFVCNVGLLVLHWREQVVGPCSYSWSASSRSNVNHVFWEGGCNTFEISVNCINLFISSIYNLEVIALDMKRNSSP